MRDHPLHNEAILAGLWGGHNYHNLRYPHSTPTTIIDLTQPQPRGPAEAGAVLPAGQRGLHQRPARAAGGGVARGQVTRDADSDSACLHRNEMFRLSVLIHDSYRCLTGDEKRFGRCDRV